MTNAMKIQQRIQGMDVEIWVENINPARAAYLLRKNTNNRSLKAPNIVRMMRDMNAQHWQFNGDTIRIATDGELLDGQNRLTACARSGQDFTALMITGLDKRVKATIDSGSKRTIGDRLMMAGVPNANATAAAINYLWQIAHGVFGLVPTASEALDVLAAHPQITTSVTKGLTARSSGMKTKISAIHYIAAYTGHPQAADDYVAVWASGVPCFIGDPVHLLRERILKTRNTPFALLPNHQMRLACHAMNLFIARKPTTVLKHPEKMRIPGWTIEDLLHPTTLRAVG